MDISIIVAFDNNAPLMENFLFKVLPFIQDRPDRELVLAADKCLNSDTIQVARDYAQSWHNVHLIEISEKSGYSVANNIAVGKSCGEYLLFMNTDIFPEPDAIDILRKAFDVHGGPRPLGAIQGRLLYPQNRKVMSTGHCFYTYMNHHLYQGRDQDDPVVLKRGFRQALNSAFLMMPAKVYAEFGGMDEFFYNAYDGMDLTLRVGRAGYELVYEPAAVAWHSTGGSRDYIRHNNEYQSKYFYAHTGLDIENDLASYLAPQLASLDLAEEYYPIDCTFCADWNELCRGLGIGLCAGYVIEERDSSRIDLFRNLPPSIQQEKRPLLFVVNHFNDVTANKLWFSERGNGDDLIIDFFGNVFTLSQLGLA